jgi:hypothetical protein
VGDDTVDRNVPHRPGPASTELSSKASQRQQNTAFASSRCKHHELLIKLCAHHIDSGTEKSRGLIDHGAPRRHVLLPTSIANAPLLIDKQAVGKCQQRSTFRRSEESHVHDVCKSTSRETQSRLAMRYMTYRV